MNFKISTRKQVAAAAAPLRRGHAPPHPEDRTPEHATPEHLTADQIDSQLVGDLGPPWSDHLAACTLCEDRVVRAAAPLLDFKAVTLAWGERRSATLPLHQEIARSAKGHPRLAWAAAASALLAIGIALPVISHQPRPEAAQVSNPLSSALGNAATVEMSKPVASESSSAKDQIVRDNQMLQAIDRELDASVESPETLGLESVNDAAQPKSGQPAAGQDPSSIRD